MTIHRDDDRGPLAAQRSCTRLGIRPRRVVLAMLLELLAAGTCAAVTSAPTGAGSDPLQAPECHDAIASLQAQEAAADAGARRGAATAAVDGRVPSAALLAARRDAARRCLASRADPPMPPERLIRSPIAIAPIAAGRAAAPVVGRAQPAMPSRTPIPGPRTVTSCDAGGCWTNDGARLDRFGPNLWGKHGVCTLSGAVLQCP